MAVTPQGNRLLPAAVLVVLLLVALLGLRSCGNSGAPTFGGRGSPTNGDADLPADTVRTLTAQVQQMRSEMATMRKDNEELRQRDGRIADDVTNRLRPELGAQHNGTLNGIQQRLDRLEESRTGAPVPPLPGSPTGLTGAPVSPVSSGPVPGTAGRGSDLPIGFGYDGSRPGSAAASGGDGLIWVRPLGREAGQTAAPAAAPAAVIGGPMPAVPQPPQPVYTINRDATLIGATAMTALIGRVPVGKEVQDPMPFKVLIGADNLAANGITIPGIEQMVMTGYAVGDATLQCARGRITSATFVFDDGTIRTVSAGGTSAGGSGGLDGRAGAGGGEAAALGWISDERGVPCVSGQYVSNGTSYLAGRAGVALAQAAAEAAAAAQTTTSVSGFTQGSTSTVTGDTGRYVLGRAAAGAGGELGKWLDERAAQAFDAVYVAPGARIAVHLDRQIDIDYDPAGRRVSHGPQRIDPYRRARLD